MPTLPLVVCIMGPTASGKTALGLALSQQLNGEIISVDSALVFRSMDIGTAKPSKEELALCPHHLIDIIEPTAVYSASAFCHATINLMHDITARGKTPILVGGTMMYFNALLNGLHALPASDRDIRADIEQQADQHGWAFIHKKLEKVDPQSAQRIHPNDPQRLQRALEIYLLSGKTMTEHLERPKVKPNLPFDVVQIALSPRERSSLHQKIVERFEIMLSNGFEAEVCALRSRKDLHLGLPSMRTVGYRQMWQYFDGTLSYAEMKEKAIIATRQLAKRQFTWLKGWHNVNWIYTDSLDGVRKQNRCLKQVQHEAMQLVKPNDKTSC